MRNELALPASIEQPGLFDAAQRATLALSVQMTREVSVSDTVFRAAHEQLGSDRLMFELIGVIAAYNRVSCILVAMGVGIED